MSTLMTALTRWLTPEHAAAIALEQHMDRQAHPGGPDLVTESAERRATAITSAVSGQRDPASGTWLSAAELPDPYGPDPVVFGPRQR